MRNERENNSLEFGRGTVITLFVAAATGLGSVFHTELEINKLESAVPATAVAQHPAFAQNLSQCLSLMAWEHAQLDSTSKNETLSMAAEFRHRAQGECTAIADRKTRHEIVSTTPAYEAEKNYSDTFKIVTLIGAYFGVLGLMGRKTSSPEPAPR